MLIVSRFKDYYDYVSHFYGSDPKIVYRRGDVIAEDASNVFYPKVRVERIPHAREYQGHLYEFKYLIINGRYFPLFRKRNPTTFAPLDEFMIATRERSRYAYEVIVEGSNHFNNIWRDSYRLDSSVTQPNLVTLSRMVGQPVFIIEHTGNDGSVRIQRRCPVLASVGLAPLYDPGQLYQDISYFVGNILNPSPDMMPEPKPPMTDKEKILSHGFDVKTSFRGKR